MFLAASLAKTNVEATTIKRKEGQHPGELPARRTQSDVPQGCRRRGLRERLWIQRTWIRRPSWKNHACL